VALTQGRGAQLRSDGLKTHRPHGTDNVADSAFSGTQAPARITAAPEEPFKTKEHV
jgi:hypothetical protein